MKKYKAAIIGCGSIGTTKPDKFDYPGGENILTHAHAYHDNPDIELKYIIDSDYLKMINAEKKWNTTGLFSMRTLKENEIDIVSVCTPTETHKDVLLSLIPLKPKVVIAEKPVCMNSQELKEVIKAYDEAQIPVIVNYTRRFDRHMDALKKDIEEKKNVVNCRILYGRGLKRDGCHAIDLCNYLFGKCKQFNKLSFGHIGEMENDISFAMQAYYENCPNVIFMPQNGKDYCMFEVDILFKDSRILFKNNGLDVEKTIAIKDNIFCGDYNILGRGFKAKTKLNKSLLNMSNHAIEVINGSESICTLQDALKVHELIDMPIIEDDDDWGNN